MGVSLETRSITFQMKKRVTQLVIVRLANKYRFFSKPVGPNKVLNLDAIGISTQTLFESELFRSLMRPPLPVSRKIANFFAFSIVF